MFRNILLRTLSHQRNQWLVQPVLRRGPAPWLVGENGLRSMSSFNDQGRSSSFDSRSWPEEQRTDSFDDAENEGWSKEIMHIGPEQVTSFIGRGGENIRQLQDRSGCNIEVEKGIERGKITLKGSEEEVMAAKGLIEDFVAGLSEMRREGMHIPTELIGRLVGRGGRNIHELQDRSSCSISVDRGEKGKVILEGSEEQVEAAKRLIEDFVEKMSGATSEDVMHIRPETIGGLIGRGGENIRELQNRSGCSINVSKDDSGKVSLYGTEEQVATAKKLIEDWANRFE